MKTDKHKQSRTFSILNMLCSVFNVKLVKLYRFFDISPSPHASQGVERSKNPERTQQKFQPVRIVKFIVAD